MTALADNAPATAPFLWIVNLWAAGAITVFLIVARRPLASTEEGRAVLFTGIGALALCVAGIARRLDWAVAVWFPPNRGGLPYAASRSRAAVFS